MSYKRRGMRALAPAAVLAAALVVTVGSASTAGAGPAPGTTFAGATKQVHLVRGALTAEKISSSGVRTGRTGSGDRAIPFRPTADPALYAAAKRSGQASSAGSAPAGLDKAPQPKGPNFKGTDKTENIYTPPDTHAAAGKTNIVEVSNSRISVYTKKGVRLSTATLNSFWGFSGPDIFDPRAVYDLAADRFIVSGVSFPDQTGNMHFFLAFSKTGDGNGAYNKYDIPGVDFGGGCWDYPQLGYDANAVIVTANFFASSCNGGYIDSRMFALPKSVGYSGGTFEPLDVFTGLPGTLAPPIVVDSGDPHLLVADTPDNKLLLFRCKNLDKQTRSCASRPSVPVPAFSFPPNATQPGTGATLDTLDGRFVNSSYQQGNTLYNLHAISMGGRAGLRWYEIDTSSSTVSKRGDTTTSATSADWNASNAVNSLGEVFVTYSSTDAANGTNAQVRLTGRRPSDTKMGKGKAVFTSSTFYTQGRWGDYSSVALEPKGSNNCPAGRRAWGANEYILNSTQWANRIARFGYC